MMSHIQKLSKGLVPVLAAALINLASGAMSPVRAGGAMGKWLTGGSALPTLLVIHPSLPMLDTEAAAIETETPSVEKQCRLNMASAHKIMGYTTLGLAVGAAVSSSSEDLHKSLGYAAAGLATLTCVTGYLEYADYFNLDDGWNATNIHIASGVAATAGFIVTAILGAGDDSHGGIGAASTVLMAVPIVALKW